MSSVRLHNQVLLRISHLASKSTPKLRDALQGLFDSLGANLAETDLTNIALAATLEDAVLILLTAAAAPEQVALRSAIEAAMVTAGVSFVRDAAGVKFISTQKPEIGPLLTTTPEWKSAVAQVYSQTMRFTVQPIVEGLRTAFAAGLNAGHGPLHFAQTAREDIRNGLTSYDRQLISNYRAELNMPGSKLALQRQLRDARYDKSIKAAVRDRKKLTPEQIDKFTAAYERRLVAWRAESAARTVAIETANAGQYAAYRQMGEQLGSQMRMYWSYTSEGANSGICPICSPIPFMNADGRAIDEPFATPRGDVSYPPVHPNCRCNLTAEVRLVKQ